MQCELYPFSQSSKYGTFINGPVHETSVLIAYMPLINAHADIFSRVRGLNIGLGLHIHPYFVLNYNKGICADSPEPSLLTI